MPNNIMGLDLSLTAPGYATKHGAGVITGAKKLLGAERLEFYHDYIKQFVAVNIIDFIVMEGYAFASKFQREALGELGGVVKLGLQQLAVPYVLVAPGTLKKYATGQGNATKDEMLAAAIKRSGLDIDNNNAADAWWLYQMGLMQYKPNDAAFVPAVQTKSLEKITWP